MARKAPVHSKTVSADERMFRSLPQVKPDENAIYLDYCENCHRDFSYKGKYINNRAIKCPYCGYEMTFFKGNYDYIPVEPPEYVMNLLCSD